jgi:hypothetical protein
MNSNKWQTMHKTFPNACVSCHSYASHQQAEPRIFIARILQRALCGKKGGHRMNTLAYYLPVKGPDLLQAKQNAENHVQ